MTNEARTADLTDAQARLLSELPEVFEIFEDFDSSDCPPTIIMDLDGSEVYRFARGDARTMRSLWSKGIVIALGDGFHGVQR